MSVDYSNLIIHHKHFSSHLLEKFGLSASDLSAAKIEELQEPRKTWLLWALNGFERAETTFSVIQQMSGKQTGRHLDVGCGTGYLCATFAKHGFESVGVDIDDLEHARLQQVDFPEANLSFLNVDLLDRQSDDLGEFDVITLDNTIEHIEAPAIMLSRLRSMLAPGGVIYLIIPNSHWVQTVLSDPHYTLFGISLFDMHDGSAMLRAVTNDHKSYEVNNWFCRYRFEHYLSLFRKYGFEPEVGNHTAALDQGAVDHVFSAFDLSSVKARFKAELAALEGRMPEGLFDKLAYVVRLYQDEMENDHALSGGVEPGMQENARINFVRTYLMGSWFVMLKQSTEFGQAGP